MPRRLATLVEGESLLNDGTAIVLFRVMVGLLATGAVTFGVVLHGALEFVLVALGGMAIGCVAILVTRLLLGWTSHSAPAQLGLTVATAYVSFIVADHFCHVSGVVATMTVGLYLGNRARLELSRDALHSMHAVWEFLALCANTLVFLAVGLVVDLHILAGTALLLPATLLVVYLARAVSVVATIEPLHRLRLCEPIAPPTTPSWCGGAAGRAGAGPGPDPTPDPGRTLRAAGPGHRRGPVDAHPERPHHRPALTLILD